MRKVYIAIIASLAVIAASTAFAQSMLDSEHSKAALKSAKSCARAASLCKAQCADSISQGDYRSGRFDTFCVDGCSTAATECAQSGCFKTQAINLCNLAKR